MVWFSELFTDVPGLVILIMTIELVAVYSGGAGFSDFSGTFVFGGLGAIKMVPIQLLKQFSAALPIFAPLAALAFLWYMGNVRVFFGAPMATLMTVALIILMLGG